MPQRQSVTPRFLFSLFTVPCSMSRKIYDSFRESNPEGDIIFETFPNAGHGISFMEDEARYGMLVDRAIDLMEERSRHD